MRVAGLFSGIGGFELAFSQAGFESHLLVEIDACAAAVLKTRFPNAEVRSDVMDLTEIPEGTEILTSGFPCQNLSMAGDKSGISGTKSSVVRKMFDVIGRSRVPVVVIENVYFMLHLESGNAMQWLVSRFEELGYKWAYRVLDSIAFGLPQRRRRVYFIATMETDPRTVLFADETTARPRKPPDLSKPLGFYWTEGRSGVGLTVDGIPPLKVGSALGIPSAPAVLFPDGEVLTPSLEACERLQGFPPGWTTVYNQPALKKNPQWRMVGNAVSVPVARWVAQRIKLPGTILNFERVSLREGQRWPDAAWNIGEGRIGVIASDKPIGVETPSISEFRDRTWARLSGRALAGFIRRAEEGGLRMPDGFLQALRRAILKSGPAEKES
jgi:DNA (cytosine-5)-methyltransferase 1